MSISKVKLGGMMGLFAGCLWCLGWGLPNSLVAEVPGNGELLRTSVNQTGETDQAKLQGTWHCVAIVIGGKVNPAQRKDIEGLKDTARLIVQGNTIRFAGGPDEPPAAPFKLNANVSPKQLDLIGPDRPMHALYSLEDGVLLVRINEGRDAGTRPTTLAVGADTDGGLLIFQRNRPAAKGNEQEAPAKNNRPSLTLAMNKMKQIALAQHIHADQHRKLAGDIVDANGKPLLSWRVKILPYLEQEALYRQFKLDESWDSTHNRALLSKMPAVYSITNPVPADFSTPFRAFTGNGAIMEPGQARGLADITDGTSNTLLFVEAASAVPWTKPDDLAFDPAKPLPKLGGRFEQDFLAAMCDGSVRRFSVSLKPAVLKKLITHGGNEIIEQEELDPKK